MSEAETTSEPSEAPRRRRIVPAASVTPPASPPPPRERPQGVVYEPTPRALRVAGDARGVWLAELVRGLGIGLTAAGR